MPAANSLAIASTCLKRWLWCTVFRSVAFSATSAPKNCALAQHDFREFMESIAVRRWLTQEECPATDAAENVHSTGYAGIGYANRRFHSDRKQWLDPLRE